MNMSFLLAGSSSTNPVLFTFAIGLMLAWKVAGYYGVDRYLLPMLGTLPIDWDKPIGSWPKVSRPPDPAASDRAFSTIRSFGA
jgi:thiosulfate dehydrogenase [quinone] large subunit